MNRTREVIFMGIGILTGITLCGPAAQAADYLKATFSSQPIYVNGQRVQMEAYSIHGNNFVKLRDIGQAVDFGVEYDPVTNSVYIDPHSSYQEEVKQVEQTPASPSATDLTEETVRSTIRALRDTYPSNTPYPAPYRSTSNGPYGVSSTNCAGWAARTSAAAMRPLFQRMMEDAGITVRKLPQGVECHVRSGEEGVYEFYLNWTKEAVAVPGVKGTDILSGETLDGSLELSEYGVAVVRLP